MISDYIVRFIIYDIHSFKNSFCIIATTISVALLSLSTLWTGSVFVCHQPVRSGVTYFPSPMRPKRSPDWRRCSPDIHRQRPTPSRLLQQTQAPRLRRGGAPSQSLTDGDVEGTTGDVIGTPSDRQGVVALFLRFVGDIVVADPLLLVGQLGHRNSSGRDHSNRQQSLTYTRRKQNGYESSNEPCIN